MQESVSSTFFAILAFSIVVAVVGICVYVLTAPSNLDPEDEEKGLL